MTPERAAAFNRAMESQERDALRAEIENLLVRLIARAYTYENGRISPAEAIRRVIGELRLILDADAGRQSK